MRRQENLWLKFVRHWYGIDSRLDERSKAVHKIYLKAIIEGILCFIPCMIGSAFSSSVANNGSTVNILFF